MYRYVAFHAYRIHIRGRKFSKSPRNLPTPATEDTSEPDFTMVVGGSLIGADVFVQKSNYTCPRWMVNQAKK